MNKGSITQSEFYKNLISNKFIYRTILSVENIVLEKDLICPKDYEKMLKLRDPFCEENMNVITEVRNKINAVLIEDEYFKTAVYFKPKKVGEKNDGSGDEEVEFRPIHSSSLITLIATVVLLNSLIWDVDDKNGIQLNELAKTLPSNFYGNIPSSEPDELFKPWPGQYKEYVKIVTESYKKYRKTKEYKYEVSLDLKSFFPSINPLIVYERIIDIMSAKYTNENDIACIKLIVLKLLLIEVSNIEKCRNLYYKDEDSKGSTFCLGIPQGLPHAYFFANLYMKDVSEIYKRVFTKESVDYYYVDDSVIYTNILPTKFKDKIDEINTELQLLNGYDEENKKKPCEDLYKKDDCEYLKKYFDKLHMFDYKLEAHKEGKSVIVDISGGREGQNELNIISRLASKVSYNLSSLFSESEEITILKKIEILSENLKTEIDTVKEYKDPDFFLKEKRDITVDQNELETYLKLLYRFRKFFKYRQKYLGYKHDYSEAEKGIKEILIKFNELDKKEFVDELNNDILLNELRYFFYNYMEFEDLFSEQVGSKVDELLFSEGTDFSISYINRMVENLPKIRNIIKKSNLDKYTTVRVTIRKHLWEYRKEKEGLKENRIIESLRYIYSLIHNYDEMEIVKKKNNHEKSNPNNIIYKKINDIVIELGIGNIKNSIFALAFPQSQEFLRIFLNAYFSELMLVNIDDNMQLVKSSNIALSYNEARLLFFLRNRYFQIESFYEKFKDYKTGEVLDYKLLEVMTYFSKFVVFPNYIDNLILVHKYTTDIWKNGSKYLHFYTLHNQEHAAELIKAAVKIINSIDYFQIKLIDYYILFISCYLHDIAMVLHPNLYETFIVDNEPSNIIYSEFLESLNITNNYKQEDLRNCELCESFDKGDIKKLLVDYFIKLDTFFENAVRDSHQKESAQFVSRNKDLYFIDEALKHIIAEVCCAHGYDVVEIYRIKSEAKDSIISEKYLKILLRLADLMDMSSSRISNPILENNRRHMSNVTQFHWLSHKAISKVDIAVNYTNNPSNIQNNEAFLGKNSISETIDFIINLNVKHITSSKKSTCTNNFRYNYNNKDGRSGFLIFFDKEGSCEKCDFMCRWMEVKNRYLYNELKELQKYLNKTDMNIFKTSIRVVYVYDENAVKLNNYDYKLIADYIS